MPEKPRRLLLVALLLVLPGIALAQSDEEKTRDQLRQLEKDIKRINWEISNASTRRSKLQDQLRAAEVELGKVKRDIAGARQDIESGKRELEDLQQQRGTMEQSRDQQQASIAQEMKSAWQTGGQGQLKVLLNQESPHTIARSLAYYRYFFNARNALLEEYRKTLVELQTLQERIDTTLATLEERRQALVKQQQSLVKVQASRELAVLELSGNISSKAGKLKQLEQDRKELESLLRAIEEAVDKLEVPADYQAFSSARGKMPWPVQGKLRNRFGRPRNEGKMRWQGVTIPAKEGSTVAAIHHGRVVYADWLRGSGLLLIIDHGGGYMSLYAHNQSLLKDVGEWVTAGSPISTVGMSGGLDTPALYFEVRHNGKPTDPSKWCSG